MNKILINVFVPVIAKSFDMFIPPQSPMYEIIELIKKAVTELSDGRFISKEDTVLCYRKSGEIIDINSSVAELNLCNGLQLMLI